MRRLLALVCLLALALPATTAGQKRPRLTCSSGQTMFVDGSLRIFAITERNGYETSSDHYACLGRRRGPVAVGSYYSDAGTGFRDVPRYVFAGGRYLGSYRYSDGEGGPSADFVVADLRGRGFTGGVLCCNDEWDMLVAADGSLVTLQEGSVYLKRSAGAPTTQLSAKDAAAADIAIRGGTVYWSEPAARSFALDGVSGSDEPRVLMPTTPRRTTTPCATAKGRTVAASASVRVYEVSAGRRFACRYTRRLRRVRVRGEEAPVLRVVADRWVLRAGEQGVRILDSVTRRWVTKVDAPVTEPTLLRDGTLAWIDDAGRVLAQKPADDAPTELGTGGSALASGGKTVYWTSGGQPQRAVP